MNYAFFYGFASGLFFRALRYLARIKTLNDQGPGDIEVNWLLVLCDFIVTGIGSAYAAMIIIIIASKILGHG